VLEEIGIDRPGDRPDMAFSLVHAAGRSSVGSTFLATKPDADALTAEIMDRGARFVPELLKARVDSVRACARPNSFDGRPIIGAIEDVAGLFICAGHGPWGISTGPASARLVADQMLGLAPEQADFSPRRLTT
jgi:glycine/D-amino acid oxidase-like deaminating enzyme